MMQTILIYLVAINLLTFILYGIDKLKAKKSWWRIPEASLIGLAIIGGSLGAWLGMKVWHHKTLHKKFRYGIPAIIIIQAALAVFLLTSCSQRKQADYSFPVDEQLIVDTTTTNSVDTVVSSPEAPVKSTSTIQSSHRNSRSYDNDETDGMRGFDPASEDDTDDNGMSRYMENYDEEGWD